MELLYQNSIIAASQDFKNTSAEYFKKQSSGGVL